MKKILLCFFCSLFIAFGFTAQAAAQSATATLSGTVTDERGATVAGATVKITDTAKAFERAATTNGDGFFIFTQLAPSSYSVSIAQNGFAATQTNVVLNVNDQRAVRIELKVAAADATVNVNDEASLVDDSPAVSTVVNRQFIENQPLN